MSGSVFAQPTVEEQEVELASLRARLAVIETKIKEQQVQQDKTDAALKRKQKKPQMILLSTVMQECVP